MSNDTVSEEFRAMLDAATRIQSRLTTHEKPRTRGIRTTQQGAQKAQDYVDMAFKRLLTSQTLNGIIRTSIPDHVAEECSICMEPFTKPYVQCVVCFKPVCITCISGMERVANRSCPQCRDSNFISNARKILSLAKVIEANPPFKKQ